jgi:tetratricopeptide (TPR) repeat protein
MDSVGEAEIKDADWDDLRSNLTRALELDPTNPDINDYLGLSIEGRFADVAPKDETAAPYRQEALMYYRKAVSLRPVWPYSWVNLALVKYRLGQTDAEFYKALHTATELGPWEPTVQRVVVDIGLHFWNGLAIDERHFILETIARGIQHADRKHSRKILELVKRYGFLEYICIIHEKEEHVQKYCKRHLGKKEKRG